MKVTRYAMAPDPEVSVVIPSLDGDRGGNVPRLLAALREQAGARMEVILVTGMRPQGRAINIGVSEARGRFITIMDDDIGLGSPSTIPSLLSVLREYPDVGMVGASILPPPDGNRLQRRLAAEMPRLSMPVVPVVTDSDMPCHGCCAMSAELFGRIGRENEEIRRGLDPDLRMRIRKEGLRVVLAPGALVYHPLPSSLREAATMFFRNGMGSAYAQRLAPHAVYDTPETTHWSGETTHVPFAGRVLRFPLRTLSRIARGHLLRALGDVVYLAGYAWEWMRTRN